MLKACYGNVKGHALLENVQAPHLSHTHTLSGQTRRIALLCYSMLSVEQTSCVCRTVCDTVCDFRSAVSQRSEKRPCLLSSRHDKAECLWLYFNPELSPALIYTICREKT